MKNRIPLFLKPDFKERIWGGTKLRESFSYRIPSDTTGECWGISAHPNGPSVIKNGPLEGLTLAEAWSSHRELFDHYPSNEFPLLTKILDAKTDLSVQVHPDDDYARKHEHQPFGKTECWYIIDCEAGAEIVYGHRASSRANFQKWAAEGDWSRLLRRVKIKPGDFFFVPSGTIHAICGGSLILETQQSSDITYRVYDYDRKGADGKKRQLHLKQSLDVTMYPHRDPDLTYHVKHESEAVFTELLREQYFTVSHWDIRGHLETIQKNWPFLLMSVIDGRGELRIESEHYPIKKGDHLIMPSTVDQFSIDGVCDLIVSSPV
ncbi:mannose-6-phosphate isomerase, class I [Terrilactibacillus sp. S3-3]|nr:mannose-6-phosphate isomerase, class I [Terrilactibacillus sp. S3-3]